MQVFITSKCNQYSYMEGFYFNSLVDRYKLEINFITVTDNFVNNRNTDKRYVCMLYQIVCTVI